MWIITTKKKDIAYVNTIEIEGLIWSIIKTTETQFEFIP
jgi:hypothetical protein